jgi:hypothetical protein
MWRAKGFTLNAIKSSSASGKRKLLVNPLHDVLCRGHKPKGLRISKHPDRTGILWLTRHYIGRKTPSKRPTSRSTDL